MTSGPTAKAMGGRLLLLLLLLPLLVIACGQLLADSSMAEFIAHFSRTDSAACPRSLLTPAEYVATQICYLRKDQQESHSRDVL